MTAGLGDVVDEKLPDLHAQLLTRIGIQLCQVTVTVDLLQNVQNETLPVISFSFPAAGNCAASR